MSGSSSAEDLEADGGEEGGLEVGTLLDGRYRIDAVLGSGGMGRVYRGEHIGIGRAVAIKVLHATMHRNREAAARFQREALASGRLDHPNIVGVTDFGTLENGACFLVMEALEGESLGQRLDRDDRLPLAEALRIMRDVLQGLAHAHERGVVHRDIKPDNIFLARKDGALVVKILDFGIAKLYAGDPNDPAATGIGLTVGTPAYLSPEQAAGGEITPSSDLYSSTVVLFELITGRAPFEAADPLAMLGAHALQVPPRARAVAPELELPLELDELLWSGLAKRPADRVASATAYLAALEPFLAATSSGSGPTPTVRAATSNDRPAAPAASLGVAATAMQLVSSPVAFAAPSKLVLSAAALGATEPLGHVGRPVTRSEVSALALSTSAVGLPALAAAKAGTASTLSLPAFVKKRRWPLAAFAAATVLLLVLTRHGAPRAPVTPAPPPPATAASGSPQPPAPSAKPVATTKPVAKSSASIAAAHDSLPDTGSAVASALGAGSTTPAADRVAAPDVAPADAVSPAVTAALAQLRNAKSCPLRRAAIAKLVKLDEPRVIPDLERARRRMYGGVLGLGEKNANGCLVKAANAAIKSLKR